MGVTGLTSYVQQVLPPAGEPICWPLDQGNEGEATRRQVILIDGNSYVHHVAKEMPNWALGAPHLALIQKLKENIHLWKRAGFLPHFIFDGILPSHKAEERIRRDSEKIGRVNTVLELINNNKNRLGVSQNTVASSIATSLLAPLLIPACIAVINDLGLPVNLPLGEADLCLAKLARDMNAPVLSLDSDFFIHDLDYQQHGSSDEDGPATLSGYIPMNTVQHAPDNISAQVFTRDRVSQSLNIHPAHLPVLAALSGCDYITHVDRHHTTQDLLGTKLKGRSRIKHILTLLEKHKETDSALLVDVLLEGLPECASKELANELKFAIEQYGDGITRSSASTSVEGPIYRLHAKGEFNNKIVEMASYRTFWCTPFLEDTTRVFGTYRGIFVDGYMHWSPYQALNPQYGPACQSTDNSGRIIAPDPSKSASTSEEATVSQPKMSYLSRGSNSKKKLMPATTQPPKI
ncbi:PIN domain-like protein [Phlyctochytrium arcticum]|nr:PIN domain-like protein [Phlyctochytrium arcticum]